MQTSLRDDWGLNLQAVVCDRCDWNFLLMEGSSRECPHCFEGQLQDFEASGENLPHFAPPELLLLYRIDKREIGGVVEKFTSGIPFPPEDLTIPNLISRAQRVFLPMWLVDAHVEASWQAELGYPYQVESHKSSYSGGQWASQKVLETRLDWEKRLGRLQRDYQNVAAPALDKHNALMTALGGFPKRGAEAYQSNHLKEAYIRLPQRATADAFPDAQENFRERAGEEILQAAEAEQIRDLRWKANYQRENWSLLLLPAYLSYYLDDEGNKQRVYVNGQNAFISGVKRASMKHAQKWMFAIFAVSAALLALALGIVFFAPQYENMAALLAVGAALIGLSGFFPVIQVWRFNGQQEQATMS